jgi:hypothetical protein
MNHKIAEQLESKNVRFDSLLSGDFFLYDKDLFVRTRKNHGTCFARHQKPCFEQDCYFGDDSVVEKREVTITVH